MTCMWEAEISVDSSAEAASALPWWVRKKAAPRWSNEHCACRNHGRNVVDNVIKASHPAGTMLGLLGSHGMHETNLRTKMVREESNGNGSNGVTLIEGFPREERPLKRPISPPASGC